jgi:hypothetical protein
LETYTLRDFPLECLYYLIPMSIVHLVVFAIGCIALAFISERLHASYRQLCIRWALFSVVFLITASIANGVWSYLIFGRLYFSTDYVFDFSPFWPITQRVIDARFGDQVGQLYGITLAQLQIIWFVFALLTWFVAGVIYSILRRFRFGHLITHNGPNNAMQRMAWGLINWIVAHI